MNKKSINLIAIVLILIISASIMGGCNAKNGVDSSSKSKKFPAFKTTDLSGKEYDNSLFRDHKLTVVNYWFNSCPACLSEMPVLEKLSTKWKEKDVNLVGINIEAHMNKQSLDEAKKVVKEQGVTYTNLLISDDNEFINFANSIQAFPTTYFVNSKGEIVGDAHAGAIVSKESQDYINKLIDKHLAKENKK